MASCTTSFMKMSRDLVPKHRKVGKCNIEDCTDSRTTVDTPFSICSAGFGNHRWWEVCRRLSSLIRLIKKANLEQGSVFIWSWIHFTCCTPCDGIDIWSVLQQFPNSYLTFLNTRSARRMANEIDDYILCADDSSLADTIAAIQRADDSSLADAIAAT